MSGIKLAYRAPVSKVKCKLSQCRRPTFIRGWFSEITRQIWLEIGNSSRKSCIWGLIGTALIKSVLGQATPPSQEACNRFTSLTAKYNHQSISLTKRSLCEIIRTGRCNSLMQPANQGLTQVASLNLCAIQVLPIRTVRKPTQSCSVPPFPTAADRFT